MEPPLFTPETRILCGSSSLPVPADLLASYRRGDRLLVVQQTGDLLLIPAEVLAAVVAAVSRASEGFTGLCCAPQAAVTMFYERFAAHLEDDGRWREVSAANERDVAAARERGRATTRLEATERMRRDMIAGLRAWRDSHSRLGQVVESVHHDGWRVEQVVAPLGMVGFVFEGRPNVFADATGVLRSGNAVILRIGSDALGTARAMMRHALEPALAEAGLPPGAVTLVDRPERAAGWALFSDPRLSLAVARGSGPAVAQLGAVARQAGTPVSLHGTGGAWIIADSSADPTRLEAAVYHSLDRKVCNTLNVLCLPADRPDLLHPALHALRRAGNRRGSGCKLHVTAADLSALPAEWREGRTTVRRASGECEEPLVDLLEPEELGREWEWEETPEITLKLVSGLEEAVHLFNRHSPRFIASLVSEDRQAHEGFYAAIDAPFVGDGFTRWVDGQYAFNRPELGLSNWEGGRLFARGGVLSGGDVYTLRTRARQDDPHLHR